MGKLPHVAPANLKRLVSDGLGSGRSQEAQPDGPANSSTPEGIFSAIWKSLKRYLNLI